MRKLFDIILYLGLLAGGLQFTMQAVQDCLNGSTDYSKIKDPLTPEDLPTLTFCFPQRLLNLNISNDFFIELKVIEKEEETIILVVDKKVATLYGLEFQFSEFWKAESLDKCYKITPHWTGDSEIDFSAFKIQLTLKFDGSQNQKNLVTWGYLHTWFTSESNAFGLAGGKWYDGNVDEIDGGWIKSGSSIHLYKITEYRKIESTCSDDSYYECLAKRFASLNTTCHFDGICAPFSLPLVEKKIALCQSDTVRACQQKIIRALEHTQDIYCKKTCNVKEYKREIKRNSFQPEETLFQFEYRLSVPKATKGDRTMSPFKIVHEEYLITWISLIGTVGGALGLFVSFSLTGTLESTLVLVPQLWSKFKKRRQNHPDNSKMSKFKLVAGASCQKLFHLGLLVNGLLLSKQYFVAYFKGKTGYSVSQQDLSPQDIPTLVICLQPPPQDKFIHGNNLYTNVTYYGSTGRATSTLELNKPVINPLGFHTHISELQQSLEIEKKNNGLQCFKVSSRWYGNDNNVRDLGMQISFTHSSTFYWFLARLSAKVWITSEDNSYGIVNRNWFDGEGNFDDINAWTMTGDLWKITQVNQYDNLDSICSRESFYQCLVRRFQDQHFSAIHPNGAKCNFEQICVPYSLPSEMPLCRNETDRICYEDVLKQLHPGQKHCKKLCGFKEYVTKKERQLNKDTYMELFGPETFAFNVEFVTTIATTNRRSSWPFKVVKTEYWIMPWPLLMGNVGGMLGMFVGFSLIGTLHRVVTKISTWIGKDFSNFRISSLTTFLYIGLLLTGFAFASQSFLDYLNGETSYSKKMASITLSDLPTISICLRTNWKENWIYSRDYMILVQIVENEYKNISLVENLSIPTLFGLKIHLSHVAKSLTREKRSYEMDFGYWPERCYKLTFEWDGSIRDVDFQKFGVVFLFEFKRSLDELKEITFAITSEQNSYGLVKQKWFDGKTEYDITFNNGLEKPYYTLLRSGEIKPIYL